MDWFYLVNGQRTGPVSEEEFLRLAGSGVITPETLVWHAGMAEWQPLRGTAGYVPPAPSAFAPPVGYGAVAGAPPVAGRYAGFWIRFVAIVIDSLILGAASALISSLFGVSSHRIPRDIDDMSGMGLFQLTGISTFFSVAVAVAYQVYFLTTRGATLGKMAFGLRVVTATGGPISPGLAVGRYFCYWIDSVIAMIGFIIAAFDREKRALHDHICGTRVIHTR